MHLIVTRTFPPEVGGMQNLMYGLAKSLSENVMIKVFADQYPNQDNFDKELSFSIERVSGPKIFKKYRKANLVNTYLENNKKVKAIISDHWKSLENIKIEEWEETIKTNLHSHFYYTKYSIPFLKKAKKSSVINLSSTAGLYGFAQRSPYTASKWAVIGLTKTLAMELGKYKIRVNAICPGSVEGDRMKRVVDAKALLTKTNPKKVKQEFESMVSLQTFVNKEDIASMALFLLSDESQNISGQAMTVDGNTERMN